MIQNHVKKNELEKTMILLGISGQIERFKKELPGWAWGFFFGFTVAMIVFSVLASRL